MEAKKIVGESGMSVPLVTSAATAHVESTPLPVQTGFIFTDAQTMKFRGCAPLH